mmetsp:Transcript_5008/g.12968  ORF Transcript_5008/g.12968 Transcript_5008/m.12968 type:complete len:507 (-) Transcript_5008:14-1534(-)
MLVRVATAPARAAAASAPGVASPACRKSNSSPATATATRRHQARRTQRQGLRSQQQRLAAQGADPDPQYHDCLQVTGGKVLRGEITISGSKNGALALMAAALLCRDPVVLREVPALMDVRSMIEVLRSVGAAVTVSGNAMEIQAAALTSVQPCEEAVRSLRAGFLAIGPLLSREREAVMALPGGCDIGARPVDLHLQGLEAMGAQIRIEGGLLHATCPAGLKGATISLSFPSVGATETLLMAAALAEGTTVIRNAAREPEVAALAEFVNAMGGRVSGAGTATIAVEGVAALAGGAWTVLPDRIEAGTFAIAAAITGSRLLLQPVVPGHMQAAAEALRRSGVEVDLGAASMLVIPPRTGRLAPTDIQTAPHPGFPTDLQPQMTALLATAAGRSTVREAVFDGRVRHAQELRAMGADIRTADNRTLHVWGRPSCLRPGACVAARDLRGGAALLVASLAVEGATTIQECWHMDRGYEQLDNKLRAVGADIQRVPSPAITAAASACNNTD